MARPEEKGLKYYPFDVDFFNDEKIEAISGEFGIKGEIVAVRLLCAIYRNGYFIEWSDLYKMKFLRNLPGISSDLLDTIILRLVKWGFFDKDLFNSAKVLTSRGIQRRYFEAIRRRKQSGEYPYRIDESPSGGKPQSKKAHLTEVASFPATAPPPTVPSAYPEGSNEDYFEELHRPSPMRDNLCMRFHLTSEQLEEKLSTFLLDCQCRQTVHQDRRDAINHFNDWLRIVIEAEKKQKDEQSAKSNQANRRRGVQKLAPTSEDYGGAF